MKPCLTATDWFLLLLVVLLGAWDVLAYGTGWMPTISATIPIHGSASIGSGSTAGRPSSKSAMPGRRNCYVRTKT